MKLIPQYYAGNAMSDAQYVERIRNYYDETWLDYRILWMNTHRVSCGFGYWDQGVRNHAHSLIRMNEILAQHARLRAGLRVLDAGCGVGFSAIWMAEKYRTPVVGITLVRNQVERARAMVRRRHLESLVRIEQQDYRCTSFPDASFDVVWAKESMDYAPDKRDFLQEVFRLLKPGGRLVVEDGFRFARPYEGDDEALMRSWLSGWAILDLATRDEFVQWTCEAGFEDVQMENIQPHMFPSHRRLYRIANLFYPGEWALHKLRVRSDTQHGNIRAARDQYHALRRIITPPLVAFLWWRNRMTDPGPGATDEIQVPLLVRRAFGFGGGLILFISVLAFIFPNLLIISFIWPLTDFSARLMAGWLSIAGVGGITLALEPRWSGWRVLLEAAFVGIIFFVLALPRAWGDLLLSRPTTWVMLLGLAGIVVGFPVFYIMMGRRR